MRDEEKTREQLTQELARLRQELAALRRAPADEVAAGKPICGSPAESESWFRWLAESLPQLVWGCDPSGACDFLSRQWLDYTGVPVERQLGRGWLDQIHPDDRQPTLTAWHQAVSADVPFDVEYRVRRHDGVYRWFKTRATPLRNAHGQIVRWFGTSTDIDDLKRAEAERERLLREVVAQRQRFQAVVEHAPAGIALLRPPSFVFELVNPAYQAIVPEAAMVGRTVAEVFPDLASEVLPLLEGVVRTGERYSAVDRHFRIRRVPEAAFEDIYFTFTYEPICDAERQVEAVLVLVIETTVRVLARTELERLLAELDATIASAPAAIVIYDPSGRIVRMNPAAERIMGYSPTDLALTMAEIFASFGFADENGRLLSLEEYPPARALRGERVGSATMSFQRDDRKVWIYDGAGPIRARDGTLLGAVASFVDISDLRNLQEEQRQLLGQLEARASELAFERDRLRTLVDSIADAVFVCDAQGAITLINAAGLALLGGPSGVVGRPLVDCLHTLQLRYPDGQTVPTAELTIRRALSGITERGRQEVGTSPRTRESIHLLVSAAPLLSRSGRVVGAVEVAADITAMKRAEAEREQLLERMGVLAADAQQRAAEMKAVLDNMVDAVFVCAADGRVVLDNPAAPRLFGLTSFAEVRNLPGEFPTLFRLRHLDGRPIASEEMATARALKGQTVVDDDQIFRNPQTGEDHFIRVSASPIRVADGRILGAVAVARDVTELTELDRLKDQFVAVAAHELKTPVTIVKGYAETLLKTDRLPPAERRMLQAIDRGTVRIDGIVKDLLDVSQLHLGSLKLSAERVDLAELVEMAVDRVAPTTTKHRVRVVGAEQVSVQADRERLGQVLQILLDNAIRYSPQGGDIDVTVTVRDGEAVISVRDRGVGIPKEKQARIFERFYRAHTGTPYDYGGMGVGLYIAREIVRRHGGRMWFESEEGRGSTFYFSVPLGGTPTGLSSGGSTP